MNEQHTPHAASTASTPSVADLTRLHRMVEGLIDADLLLAADGDPLLEMIEAARQARAAGDRAAVCRHTARCLRALEALIRSEGLDAADGRLALDSARRLLNIRAG